MAVTVAARATANIKMQFATCCPFPLRTRTKLGPSTALQQPTKLSQRTFEQPLQPWRTKSQLMAEMHTMRAPTTRRCLNCTCISYEQPSVLIHRGLLALAGLHRVLLHGGESRLFVKRAAPLWCRTGWMHGHTAAGASTASVLLVASVLQCIMHPPLQPGQHRRVLQGLGRDI